MPFPMKKKINAKGAMVQIVSKCLDEVLQQHVQSDLSNADVRIEICLDVTDAIIRFVENPKKFKK
jgi:hypothetical protein|tara:strand:- start:2004 stop:2198 length:195 start_codon:yes stop_codon:yes gene_type:complete